MTRNDAYKLGYRLALEKHARWLIQHKNITPAPLAKPVGTGNDSPAPAPEEVRQDLTIPRSMD